MNKTIQKVAILGSGVMGSRIACHFAGIGVQVLLLDIVPAGVNADEKKSVRNKIVNDALQSTLKSNPSPVYHKNVSNKSKFLIDMLSNSSLVLAKSKWLARPR